MKTEPNIETIDLIKVKVIKKKHIEGLRGTREHVDFRNLELLGYITEWDAILTKNVSGHFGVAQAHQYYAYIQDSKLVTGAEWQIALSNAQAFVHSLPQLFLD